MNSSNTDDWTNANGALQSPKKRLHIKVKDNVDELTQAVTNVRNTLKHAKDISARNLMDHQYQPTNSTSISGGTADTSDDSSDYEEVVAIEEEPTDYTPYVDSENSEEEYEEEEIVEVEYEEEIIDDDDTESSEELEALPPPITIPKALKVKDSEDEKNDDEDSSDDESSSSTEEEEEEEEAPVIAREVVEKAKVVEPKKEEEEAAPEKEAEDSFDACPRSPPRKALDEDVAARPGTIRGYSYNPELPNPNAPLKKWKPPKKTTTTHEEELPQVSPKRAPTSPKRPPASPKKHEPNNNIIVTAVASSSPETKSPDSAKKWKHPTAPRVIGAPKRAPSLRQFDVDGRPDISWTKPDWAATGPKLRSTGKSAAENLAKPITSLPHMKKNYYGNDDNANTEHAAHPAPPARPVVQRPTAPRKAASKIICPAPQPSDPAEQTEKPHYPKSPGKSQKPSAARAALPSPALAADNKDDNNSEHKPIEWEKPDWAKTRVLRATSKTDVLYSGKDIARPIGGIRPVEDDNDK